MDREDEIVAQIDEIVDDLQDRIATAASKLGLEDDAELINRVANELKARLLGRG